MRVIDAVTLLQTRKSSSRSAGPELPALAESSVEYGALAAGLLLAVPLLVRRLGGLPPEHQDQHAKDAQPPRVLLWVTGALCVGVMANITVILLTVQYETAEMTVTGYVLASECLGALCGLLLFRQFGLHQLKTAYQLTAMSMVLGNGLYAWSCAADYGLPALFAARALTGLGAGAMYNTAMVMVHFARGSQKTPHMVLYQFFVAFGVLLGPAVASVTLHLAPDLSGPLKAAIANAAMVLFGLGLWLAVLCLIPADISQLEEQAGITGRPQAEGEPEDGNSGQGLALLSTLVGSAVLRMAQRLLWESGSVIAVQAAFGWSSSQAGAMFVAVVACMAASQYLYSQYIAGKYSDVWLLRTLELMQLLGVLLMFQPWPLPRWLSILQFMTASVLAYCSNALWAGVLSSFCVKRSQSGSFFSSENIMLFNQSAIFIGIIIGCIISRAVQELVSDMSSPRASLNALAATLLVGAGLQLNLSMFAMSRISMDYFMFFLAGAVGVVITAGALLTSWGGTGPWNVFTWHVVCMGLAWPCLAVLGYWAYKADGGAEKETRRSAHMLSMLGVAGLSAAGYFFVFRAHVENGEGQLGGLKGTSLTRGSLRFAHVVLGYLVLLGALAQVPLGLWKRRLLGASPPVRAFAWHGTLGRALLLGALGAVALGTWIDFGAGWPRALRLGLTCALGALGAAVL
ncbi:unnamed protein product [Effrenium voratum]|nr:unnamed protein product [Effrenium voratum]